MKSGKQPHILTTSSNLMGICLVIVTGLKISKVGVDNFADEISLFASFILLLSCFFSFFSMSSERETTARRSEQIADFLFLCGLFALFIAIALLTYAVR